MALSFFLPSSFALTNTVGSLEFTYDNDPIFAEANLVPSSAVAKTVTVKNIGGSQVNIGIQGTETQDPSNLSDKITFAIKLDGSDIYGGGGTKTLSNFFNEGEIQLAALGSGESKTFQLSTTLDSNLGNEYQGKETKFDLTIGSLTQAATTSTTSTTSTSQTSGPSVLAAQTTGEVLGISTLPSTGLPFYIIFALILLLTLGLLLRRVSKRFAS